MSKELTAGEILDYIDQNLKGPVIPLDVERNALSMIHSYTLQECEKVRRDCAENATTKTNEKSTSIIVDKQSILNTEIKLT